MIKTEIGEYIIGAYLKLILKCDVVDYNVKIVSGGLKGLSELDVIGLNFEENKAYLCEVTTHLNGLAIGSNAKDTIKKITEKHAHQIAYGDEFLGKFKNKEYRYFSPRVPVGKITEGLKKIETLEVIVNEDYTKVIRELEELAKEKTNDVGNPFFRMLQIMNQLK